MAVLDHSGEALSGHVAEVPVKQHAHRAGQQAAGGADVDAIGVQVDQAIVGHLLQLRPDVSKVAIKLNVELLLNSGKFQAEGADQLLDHGAAQAIIVIALQAAAGA